MRLSPATKRVLLAGALLTVLLIALPRGSLGATTYTKAKIVCPRSVARGGNFSVTGSGFPGNSAAIGLFDNPLTGTIAPATTSSKGAFTTTGVVASNATTGSHVLTETVLTTKATCSIKIT